MSKAITEPETSVIPPSSLYVFWPGEQPPTAEEIRLSLTDIGHPAPDRDLHSAEGTHWGFWLEVAERPVSFFVWCEQVSGEYLKFLDGVYWADPHQETRARHCHWMIGVEGPISLKEPTVDYQFQLRICDHIAREWSPIIFDASAMLFRSVPEVQSLAGSKFPPRTSAMYSIHKVCSNPSKLKEESTYWLHTHGLERAGMPDLEIFDVPEHLLTAGCELIDSIADLWTEYSTPDPEAAFTVGHNLEVAWRPWHAVVSALDRKAVGGWAYRKEELNHNGYRAVLVSPKKERWIGKKWAAPIATLEKLTDPTTTVFKTASETRRMAQHAREKWPTFGMLFAGRHPDDWQFAVKVHYPVSPDESRGEHLWFDVQSIQPGKVLGVLLSAPSLVPTLQMGDVYWNNFERVTEWRIFTPDGVYDPDTADRLLEYSHEEY